MAMSLEEFRTSVRLLSHAAGDEIRRQYVMAFVDPAAAADAPMWDGLRHRQRVSLARLWATVAANDVVIVMWDPPCGQGGTPFGAEAFGALDVLECRVADLEEGVEWLPDDLYLFDESLSWSAVFTHQTDVDGRVQLLARGDQRAPADESPASGRTSTNR